MKNLVKIQGKMRPIQKATLFTNILNLNWKTLSVSPGFRTVQNSTDLKFAPL